MDWFASWEPVEKQFTVSTEIHPSLHQYLTAVNPPNHLHNNSIEYVAVDLTRVVLQPSIRSTDYINASWVSMPGVKQRFILTMAPLHPSSQGGHQTFCVKYPLRMTFGAPSFLSDPSPF